MIGMPSAFALGISSGKFIFIFVLQKSLQAFLKHFFHRRVAVGNCIIHKRAIAHSLCATALFSFYCALYTLPIVQELSALYFAWLRR